MGNLLSREDSDDEDSFFADEVPQFLIPIDIPVTSRQLEELGQHNIRKGQPFVVGESGISLPQKPQVQTKSYLNPIHLVKDSLKFIPVRSYLSQSELEDEDEDEDVSLQFLPSFSFQVLSSQVDGFKVSYYIWGEESGSCKDISVQDGLVEFHQTCIFRSKGDKEEEEEEEEKREEENDENDDAVLYVTKPEASQLDPLTPLCVTINPLPSSSSSSSSSSSDLILCSYREEGFQDGVVDLSFGVIRESVVADSNDDDDDDPPPPSSSSSSLLFLDALTTMVQRETTDPVDEKAKGGDKDDDKSDSNDLYSGSKRKSLRPLQRTVITAPFSILLETFLLDQEQKEESSPSPSSSPSSLSMNYLTREWTAFTFSQPTISTKDDNEPTTPLISIRTQTEAQYLAIPSRLSVYQIKDIYGLTPNPLSISSTSSSSSIFPLPFTYASETCVICYDQDANTLLLPCCHLCVCFTCSQALSSNKHQCPICREKASGVLVLPQEQEEQEEEEEEEKGEKV